MGWDDGPRMDDVRDAPESTDAPKRKWGVQVHRRSGGGSVPALFWVLFVLVDVVILGAVMFFVLAR
jgi:hypothetical protein